MPSEQDGDNLLKHLESEMGEEDAQQVYDKLPDHVDTAEDFQKFIEDQADALGAEVTPITEDDSGSDSVQADQEPVVRDEEEVALEKVFRAARPLIAEFSKSQEKQKELQKEQRKEELKHQQEQHKEELEHFEKARREWLILLGGVLVMVFILVLFFGWRSIDLGAQVFRTIVVAIVSGVGGYGIGRTRSNS
jgi:cation transport ATPase